MKKKIALVFAAMLLVCSCALADDLIAQHLVNRSGGPVSDFLYPAVYSGSAFPTATEAVDVPNIKTVALWDDDILRNAQDKIVYVQSKSDSPVFFRTVVAIPAPSADVEAKIHVNYSNVGYDLSSVYSTINGMRYKLLIFSHRTALAANAFSAPSLLQIALDKTVTNDDVLALGGTFDLMIKTEAFNMHDDLSSTVYQITDTQHPWSSYPNHSKNN